MITRIDDNRIGIRTNGRISQYPSRYADGGYWNMQNNPAPTMVFFGEGNRFFYTLPVGKARLDTMTRQTLERIVHEAIRKDNDSQNEANTKETTTDSAVMQTASDTGTGGVVIDDSSTSGTDETVPDDFLADIFPSDGR